MLEHMHKMMFVKDEKHGLGYEYLLTWVFRHFGIPLGHGEGREKEKDSAAGGNISEGPGATELACLKVENKGLVDKNVELQESLLRHQEEADACLSLVVKSLTSKPPSS
ncbi:hypothetical protein KY284_030060 [Solanum tuberosum]|nr:hypothetical protein KY284_030060 [Solanum tuberosum]